MRVKQSAFLTVFVVVVVVVTSCGKRDETPPATGTSTTAATTGAATVDAATVAVVVDQRGWSERPEPALRALVTAFESFSSPDADQWLERRKLPRPEDAPPDELAPSVQAAVDALVAWDGSGALAPMPCMKGRGLNNPIPLGVMKTARVAFELSNGPNDPPAHAALRMGLALRADDNDPLAMMLGAALPKEAAESFTRRGITTPVPAMFLPADDLPWKVLASNARCATWTLDTVDLADPENADLVEGFKQMGRKPEQAMAEEAAAVKAFWADTMKQAAAAKTRAELAALLDRRISEAHAMRPQSVMVPLLGSPYAATMLLRDDE